MTDRIDSGAFAGGRSLLASRTHAVFVGESLQVEGRWMPPKGGTIFSVALSENGAHAAIGMESGEVIVWSTKSPTSRVVYAQTMTSEERLMAALLGEMVTPPAALLAVSNDGETVAILRIIEQNLSALTLVGRHAVTSAVPNIEPWTRISLNDDHVVLGRHRYALGDLARSGIDEVIAHSESATLLRTDEGAILLREGETVTALGEWDDAAFASNEIVLLRLHDGERRPRSAEVSIGGEVRVIPWDLPGGTYPVLFDCANLRGIRFEGDENVWVDLRSGARLFAVESLHND